MGQPATEREILPFTPKRKKPSRPREVVLRFTVGDDDTADGLMPEGVKATLFAIAAADRDQDYCDSVRGTDAFDQVIERAKVRCLLREIQEAGGVVRVEGETLWVKGPKGFMTDELAAKVKENKTLLMDIMER